MIKITLEGPTMKELLEQAKEVFGTGLVPGPVNMDGQTEIVLDEPTVAEVIEAAEEQKKEPKKTAAKKKTATTRKKAPAKKAEPEPAEAVEDDAVEETADPEPQEEPVDVTGDQNEADHETALAVLLDVYQNGDKEGVIELLSDYGVKKFTEIPKNQGTELLKRANALAG